MKPFLFLVASLISFSVSAQRDTIPMNDGWRFATDKSAIGFANEWYGKTLADARTVSVPHTWNVEKENEQFYGWAWYQKSFNVAANWKNKATVLQFGAINHTARIYLNGKLLTEHIGDGFNKFFVDLSGKLIYGKENVITVACTNAYNLVKVPFGTSFDWPNDGGIIRPVAMIVSGKPAASFIEVTPTFTLKDSSGQLKIKLGLSEATAANLQLRISITEENQLTHDTIWQSFEKPQWQHGNAFVTVSLPKVHPWHFDFPNLYKVAVTVLSGKKGTDYISTNIGFKQLEFKEGRTFLNGEPIKLMGVEWTAGSNPDYGFAEPASEIIRYGKLMKEVNCIFSRVHFQQDDIFYDFCDRNGILIQEEVPLWGGETPVTDSIKKVSFNQLESMIRNHFNHPSIITWGVGNELRGRDAGMKLFITELIAKARELDPDRLISYVSNTLTEGYFSGKPFVPDAGSLGDYVMMNEYGGSWWDLPVAQIGDYMDSVHKSYPDKPFFISEFGLCEPNFKGGDERRLQDLAYHMGIYESKSYVQGAIYFDLTDYRTHYPGTFEDNKYRRRIHGIYDMYGNPKPSMKVLRELSSPVEVQTVNNWRKGKLSLTIFGSLGLPQHIVSGYSIYLSDSSSNYATTKKYSLPVIKPGQRVTIEVDDLYGGKGVVTVVRPNGYIVSQKSFY